MSDVRSWFLFRYALRKDPCGGAVTALSLRPYIYGQHSISSDWYSGDAHVARMQGSMFDPWRVRYIIFAHCLAFVLGSRANASVAIPA